VVVRKAGDVIPDVVGPVLSKRPKNSVPWQFPATCPCNLASTLVKIDDQADTRCVESACPFQRDERIVYFASRAGMDIEGLGKNLVYSLCDLGLINDVADLFYLNLDQLISVGDYSSHGAAKLLIEIDRARSRPLPKLLAALGIKHVGPVVASQLAEEFGGLQEILDADEQYLNSLSGIGPAVYESLRTWMMDQRNLIMVEKLKNAGVVVDIIADVAKSDGLNGEVIVVTGKLSRYPREEIKDIIKINGGKASSSVTSNTTILVAGEKATASKIKRAEELGVRILNEDEFVSLVESGSADGKTV
jgi:DNA ligase (NAD+)